MYQAGKEDGADRADGKQGVDGRITRQSETGADNKTETVTAPALALLSHASFLSDFPNCLLRSHHMGMHLPTSLPALSRSSGEGKHARRQSLRSAPSCGQVSSARESSNAHCDCSILSRQLPGLKLGNATFPPASRALPLPLSLPLPLPSPPANFRRAFSHCPPSSAISSAAIQLRYRRDYHSHRSRCSCCPASPPMTVQALLR